MKHQYFGDINDYRKYGVLRTLVSVGWRLGVCWMVTPDDAGADGRKIEYLARPQRWRHHDPGLFDVLTNCINRPLGRHLRHVQTPTLFPKALFFDAVIPDEASARRRWFLAAMRALSDANLIFFDPDNGLQVPSKPMGRKYSSKYVFFDELASAWAKGTSLLVYQHFPRESRQVFIPRAVGSLQPYVPGSDIWSMVTGHALFLLACQPTHRRLAQVGLKSIASRWKGQISVFDEASINITLHGSRSGP